MLSCWRLVPWFAWAILSATVLAGCDSGLNSSVSGTVRYDGQIVDAGGIAFLPDVGGSARASSDIRAGHYDLDSQRGPPPGKYKVQIYWRKKTGKKVPGEGGYPKDEVIPGIPAKYNTETELTADIQPGRNTIDFDLKP